MFEQKTVNIMSNRFLESSEVLDYVYNGKHEYDLISNINDTTETQSQNNGFYTSVIKKFGLKFE